MRRNSLRRITLAALAIMLTAAPACDSGGDIGGSGDSCEAAPLACQQSCDGTNGDCPAGTHCDPDFVCTAQCTANGGECGDGFDCTADGRCVQARTPSDVDPDDCASIAVSLEPTVPTVMLLIDRSGSMDGQISAADTSQRWGAVKSALVGGAEAIVNSLDDRVVFGASLYSAIRIEGTETGAAPCPRMLETPATLESAGAIKSLLDGASPTGGTPTEGAIRHVTGTFPAASTPGAPRVLLLATDGEPDTCQEADTSPAIMTGVEDAVADAYALGIETYVLSVGSQIGTAHLQRIANEGTGADRQSGTATVYRGNTAAQLAQSFDDIIRGTRTCELDVDGTIDLGRASEGTVTLNGAELAFGTGWETVDSGTIRLIGAACDTFLGESSVSVAAEFPCGVVVN